MIAGLTGCYLAYPLHFIDSEFPSAKVIKPLGTKIFSIKEIQLKMGYCVALLSTGVVSSNIIVKLIHFALTVL